MLWRDCSKPRMRLGRRGATSLEFALVGSLLMMLLLGASEAGRYMITLQSLRSATDEAVRLVVLRGSANMNAGTSPCAGLNGALSGAADRVAFLKAASLTTVLTGCTTASNGVTMVNFSLTYPFSFNVNYFGITSLQLNETGQALFN